MAVAALVPVPVSLVVVVKVLVWDVVILKMVVVVEVFFLSALAVVEIIAVIVIVIVFKFALPVSYSLGVPSGVAMRACIGVVLGSLADIGIGVCPVIMTGVKFPVSIPEADFRC